MNVNLNTKGTNLVDPSGKTVVLKGVNAEGIAGIATFFPGGLPAYLTKVTGTDATGVKWNPNAIRLPFERYPCTDSGRLYQSGDPRIPSCIPNTYQVASWTANTTYVPGTIVKFSGQQYMAAQDFWRADKGQGWNPGNYKVGSIVVGIPGNTSMYRCTASTTITDPTKLVQAWDKGPTGTSTTVDTLGNTWVYIGKFGLSGSVAPFTGVTTFEGLLGATVYFNGYQDNLCQWESVGNDLTPTQADTAWATWTTNVLDVAIQKCIDTNLYAIVCMFDFGPAHHPLLSVRLNDFWNRMSTGKWANHPNVIFDLWNESEPVGAFDGFSPGSWVLQKPVIQSVVNTIRANGANNIVIIPTPGFCAYTDAATSSPLTGTNIVYAAHHYSEFYYGSVSDWSAHIPSPTGGNHLNLEKALASGQPVILSEWGPSNWTDTPSPDHPTIDVAPFIASLQSVIEGARPAVGNLAWAFTQNWTPSLFSDGAFTQPTVYGIAARTWINKNGTTVVVSPSNVIGTAIVDSLGHWSIPLTLASGSHVLTATDGSESQSITLTV